MKTAPSRSSSCAAHRERQAGHHSTSVSVIDIVMRVCAVYSSVHNEQRQYLQTVIHFTTQLKEHWINVLPVQSSSDAGDLSSHS